MAETPVTQGTTELEPEGAMGFLDHLEELRQRIFNIAIFLVVAFLVCWGFSKPIYNFLSVPVSEELSKAKFMAVKATSRVQELKELENGKVVTFIFEKGVTVEKINIPTGTTVQAKIIRDPGQPIRMVTIQPIVIGKRILPEGFQLPSDLLPPDADPASQLVVHTVQGAFNLYVKVAFYAAIFFSIPYILYQIYIFVSPGLYEHEKSYVWPVIIMGTFFFLLGSTFGYYIAFPRACDFLIGEAENFQPFIEANEYFDLIITIIMGLGLVFEIPTVVYFLARLGLVTAGFLLKIWRFAVVAIMILAAVLSPTSDIPNMMIFAVPMLGLYYFSVGIAFVFNRPRREVAS